MVFDCNPLKEMKLECVICFILLSMLFALTEMPHAAAAATTLDDNNSYVVSLSSYLDRSSMTLFMNSFKNYLLLCPGTFSGNTFLTSQIYSWAWQDFFVLDAITGSSVRAREKRLQDCVVRFSFLVPNVGGVAVINIKRDQSLRNVAFVFPKDVNAASQAHRRWRPRNYFGFPPDFKWTGKGVRMAFLDTGLHPDLLLSNSLKSCTSFVPKTSCGNALDDHGLFSVSVATAMQFPNVSDTVNTANDTNYLGVAPFAHVHMMRVFDDLHETRTSWCVAAINAALQWSCDVLSLSFGGNDYYDAVFTDKISAAAAAGVVIVAATGNDGPHFGSVHNPADHADVLAVGSLGFLRFGPNASKRFRRISLFSGRGPTTWELPFGAGRIRPDLVALGEFVVGVGFAKKKQLNESHAVIELRVGHGTSVAAPIVAGVAALCVEAMRQLSETRRPSHGVNIALMKRFLMGTAEELKPNMAPYQTLDESLARVKASGFYRWGRKGKRFFHDQTVMNRGIDFTQTMIHFRNVLYYSRMSQGAGEVCPLCALDYVERIYKNDEDTVCELFAFPNMIDATSAHHVSLSSNETTKATCDIYWPYCEQPLFPSATPVAFNITLHYPRCGSAVLSHIYVTLTESMGWVREEHSEVEEEISLEWTKRLVIFRAVASPVISSYTGWLSLFAFSPTNATVLELWKHYSLVVVSGYVNATYTCSSVSANDFCKGEIGQGTRVSVPFKIPIIARPARAHRVVFDVSHQWFYPPDFVPSDNARIETPNYFRRRRRRGDLRRYQDCNSFFEQLSDHPHTNMAPLFLFLRRVMGFYVEMPLLSHFMLNNTLMESLWSTILKKYYRRVGTLILMDSELPFTVKDRIVIGESVRYHKLNLLIVSEWYSKQVARGLSFYDPLKDRCASSASGFENCTSETMDRSCGLDGACHVPSINALLYNVSEGMLQLDESLVVDGKFVLGGNGHAPEQYLARLSSAGVLRRLQHKKRTLHSDTEVNHAMICGIANARKGNLRYLEKVANRDGAFPKEDLLIHVPLNTFVPVLGFFGMGNQSKKHRSGRISLVTDSNCLGGSANMQTSLRTLDRIMCDVSVGLFDHGLLSSQELVALDLAVSTLVQREGTYPSLCLDMMQEMLQFLYTGDGSRFCSGAQCEVSTRESALFESDVHVAESVDAESDRLLQRLFSVAPGRVAVGALVRDTLEEIMTASNEHVDFGADEGFSENHHSVFFSTHSVEDEPDQDSLLPTTTPDFLLSFVFFVLFFLLAVIFFLFLRVKTPGGFLRRIKQE